MKNALASTMTTLPEQLRRSLTWDRGKELSQHAAFKVETGIPVYFADPQSPWQRGTNENTNGLLRQYFPKGTDLARWSADEIEAVAASAQQPTPQDPRLENTGRSTERVFTIKSTSQCCDHRLSPVSIARLTYTERLDETGWELCWLKGDAYDNAMAEAWVATFKSEAVDGRRFHSLSTQNAEVLDFIGFYNDQRLHESLGDVPPAVPRHDYYQSM